MQGINEHYMNVSERTIALSKTTVHRMMKSVDVAKALCSNGFESNGRTRNFCFAYFHSKLFKIGMNDYSRTMLGYIRQFGTEYKKYGNEKYKPSLHAEISCLLRLGRDDCSDLDFFSVRIDKNGRHMFSKPCANCARILHQVGFKHVYFFDQELNIKCL